MVDPFAPLAMSHGSDWPNRLMLAPLTNQQSHPDGVLSDDEWRWLTMRGEGGFGVTMTCASHVQADGIGFPGQLGIWGDRHRDGLTRLAGSLAATGTRAMVQLHHAGMRTPHALIEGAPVCPSDNDEHGARALTRDEIATLEDDFVAAALRARQAGFHGVELHAAHGYLLCQFLSPELNRRADDYGGSLDNRARLLFDLVARVRSECGPDFSLGVRLSPERFGLRLGEIKTVAQRLLHEAQIDYLDMSLWDVFKRPQEEGHEARSLLDHFTCLERGAVKLGAAGHVARGADVYRALEAGLDFVIIGRSGILHHDFPKRLREHRNFEPVARPVSVEHLRTEGLGEAFIDYLRRSEGFVAP
ncbi:MAG: NADH:flavin oxidoreductase [Myxococcota bacterium]